MSAPSASKPLRGSESVTPDLPKRQKNALRLLLAKLVITPDEVAQLHYRVIERAPGIGKNSLAIIRAWLNGHGLELSGLPGPIPEQRRLQRQRKLERAIDYVRDHGYEVLRNR